MFNAFSRARRDSGFGLEQVDGEGDVVNEDCMAAELVSTRTSAASTETVSSCDTPAGLSCRSIFSVCPTLSCTPGTSVFANPVKTAVTVYVDGFNATIKYSPLSPDNADRSSPVRSFFAVIATPGMTAPLSSLMVPPMRPWSTCANAGTTSAHKIMSAQM